MCVEPESPEFYNESMRQARKGHKCSECRGWIAVGTKYKYVFGKWEGSCFVFKICIDCMIPQAWLIRECGTYVLGDLKSEILEHAAVNKAMFLYRWYVQMETRGRAALL